jgi:hypothetical protein
VRRISIQVYLSVFVDKYLKLLPEPCLGKHPQSIHFL